MQTVNFEMKRGIDMRTNDRYPEFTKAALNAPYRRIYQVFYRTKDMEKSEYFFVDIENKINVDPTKPIELHPERACCHVSIEDLCRRFRLLHKYLQNNPGMKFVIIDTRNSYNEREVMAIGENGKWKVRENYKRLLETFVVGSLPDITFVKAA